MKELKIKKIFFDYIKCGLKTFEIRKNLLENGMYKLVCVETKETLKVKLKFSCTFVSGEYLKRLDIKMKGNIIPFIMEHYNFLKTYTNKDRLLYFYDLEIVNKK